MSLYLTGPLADPAMLQALLLTGEAVTLPGRLTGGQRAGTGQDGWPVLHPGPGVLPAIRVAPNAALHRYAEVMGLGAHLHEGHSVLGVARIGGDDAGAPWDRAAWDAPLAAEIARQIITAPEDSDARHLAWRLPMIGIWAASRLRAAAAPRSGGDIVPARGPEDVTVTQSRRVFSGYFAAEEQVLTHRRHDGSTTAQMTREGFLMGDAVVLLPWDPRRDRVLLIEQFRLAPSLRGDPQPWLLEPVAGRVDAGETVETAARREALEEADLTLSHLVHAFDGYPSPGAVCEYLYQYVGIADLPDGVQGVHGLEGEAEDIRGHLLPRADLTAMVMAGQITNGPLATLALWLELRAPALRTELGLEGPG
ncbi:MAG: NUDIX domain-containing protein [Paracoccus sp. (in: a-proteobacteria)]